TLPPMNGHGAAWISKAFAKGRTALSFVANTNSSFDLVFGVALDEKFIHRLRVGGGSGTSVALINSDGNIVVESDIPRGLLGVLSGRYLQFWANYDNGTVALGLGTEPGKQMFFWGSDAKTVQQASRIGFGSNADKLTIASVVTRTPVALSALATPL